MTPREFLNKFLKQQGIELPFGLSYIRGSETLPPPLSQNEEEKYITLLAKGSQEAKQKLITHNLRLVVHIAKRYNNNTHVDIEDIISIGAIGLVKAVNSYAPNKEAKLSTYASRCIQNEILMFFRKSKYNTEVSIEEIINTDCSHNKQKLYDVLSTDEDYLFKALEDEADKKSLYEAIKKLPKRDYKIIVLRFGLGKWDKHTQEEVANIMGFSQSYLSRLEKQIFSKLKQELVHCV